MSVWSKTLYIKKSENISYDERLKYITNNSIIYMLTSTKIKKFFDVWVPTKNNSQKFYYSKLLRNYSIV